MSGNHVSNLAAAEAAWGADMPAWVRLLAEACDRTNQRQVAEKLDKSNPYVSRIVRRAYAGDYSEAEKLVRAAFGREEVACPALGLAPVPMSLRTCMTNRRRRRPLNWAHAQFARVCPGCPNNTDIEED